MALDDLILKLMAKAPTDRPWDAAAAGLVLTELRDKAEKGEKIAMVWSAETDKAVPTRAGFDAGHEVDEEEGRKQGLGSSDLDRDAAGRGRRAGAGAPGARRAGSPTSSGLLSQEYLFGQAKALMESKSSSDWSLALRNYIDPLDRRFPDNPYKAETRSLARPDPPRAGRATCPSCSTARSGADFNEAQDRRRAAVRRVSARGRGRDRNAATTSRPRRNSGTSWPRSLDKDRRAERPPVVAARARRRTRSS